MQPSRKGLHNEWIDRQIIIISSVIINLRKHKNSTHLDTVFVSVWSDCRVVDALCLQSSRRRHCNVMAKFWRRWLVTEFLPI